MIIANEGGNHYKIPHLGKEKLERQKRLPKTLPVSDLSLEKALMYAHDMIDFTDPVMKPKVYQSDYCQFTQKEERRAG